MYRIMEAVTGTESAYSTLIQTSTGTWSITYNGENRPVRFENAATQMVVECAYDSHGEGVVDLVGDRLLNANFDFNILYQIDLDHLN